MQQRPRSASDDDEESLIPTIIDRKVCAAWGVKSGRPRLGCVYQQSQKSEAGSWHQVADAAHLRSRRVLPL